METLKKDEALIQVKIEETGSYTHFHIKQRASVITLYTHVYIISSINPKDMTTNLIISVHTSTWHAKE